MSSFSVKVVQSLFICMILTLVPSKVEYHLIDTVVPRLRRRSLLYLPFSLAVGFKNIYWR